MAYEFKNLNEVPVQDAPTENTKVMAFEDGAPKQIPASEFGSEPLVFEIDCDNDIAGSVCILNYDSIYEAITKGRRVVLHQSYLDGEIKKVLNECVAGWEVNPGEGVVLYTVFRWYEGLLFTNGSYHTTE